MGAERGIRDSLKGLARNRGYKGSLGGAEPRPFLGGAKPHPPGGTTKRFRGAWGQTQKQTADCHMAVGRLYSTKGKRKVVRISWHQHLEGNISRGSGAREGPPLGWQKGSLGLEKRELVGPNKDSLGKEEWGFRMLP